MPSVEANRQLWGAAYGWPEEGDEWSAPWGGRRTQWYTSILPRLHPFLPARRVLEIAPGFGRWSSFLIPACESYVGVDLAEGMLDLLRAAAPPQVEVRQGDIEELDLPDLSFDAVACGHGLQFCPNLLRALWQARRVLREGLRSRRGFDHCAWLRTISRPHAGSSPSPCDRP